VTPAIHKADELVDFTSHLGEIDSIFFGSSAKQDFSSSQEKESFRERSLGRYIANHRGSFFGRSGFRELRTFPWNSGISVCMGRKL
jgi:hypothetical protein